MSAIERNPSISGANKAALPPLQANSNRFSWVDCAKGFCIILVVMLHSTHGVQDAVGGAGFMHYFTEFAKPFRMPDFFLISGLFLARVIDRNWRTYLDRKVVHFMYFYVLWVTIHFLVKSPGIVSDSGYTAAARFYIGAFIEPIGTLWFIYLLPFFFVITKLLRKVPPAVVFVAAVALEVAPIFTGWTVIDQTAARFVYFFAGYWLAPHIFKLAASAQARPWIALAAVMVWAVINGALVFSGYADIAGVSLLLGFLGAAAIVTIAALLTRLAMSQPIRYCGKHSIVIYLAFFLPMHSTRILLLESGLVTHADVVAIVVTAVGITLPLLLWRLVRHTRLSFLFVRPALFTLQDAGASPVAAAPVLQQRQVSS